MKTNDFIYCFLFRYHSFLCTPFFACCILFTKKQQNICLIFVVKIISTISSRWSSSTIILKRSVAPAVYTLVGTFCTSYEWVILCSSGVLFVHLVYNNLRYSCHQVYTKPKNDMIREREKEQYKRCYFVIHRSLEVVNILYSFTFYRNIFIFFY